MLNQFRPAAVSLLAMTVITGIVYPLVITGAAQFVFPHQANGSIRIENGKPVASELIGQQFTGRGYFWGRLSATSPVPYTAFNATTLSGSSGSNQGPLNPALLENVKQRVQQLQEANPKHEAISQQQHVPVDLVTASGSGLDPHISPAAAEYQIARVVDERGLPVETVQDLVRKYTEVRQLGVLGEPRVNVLLLNRAIDQASKK